MLTLIQTQISLTLIQGLIQQGVMDVVCTAYFNNQFCRLFLTRIVICLFIHVCLLSN
jgi:hypothetical protein